MTTATQNRAGADQHAPHRAGKRPTVAVVGLPRLRRPADRHWFSANRERSFTGIDVSTERIRAISRQDVDLLDADRERLRKALADSRFTMGTRPDAIAAADAVMICVPTPVDRGRAPDLADSRVRVRRGRLQGPARPDPDPHEHLARRRDPPAPHRAPRRAWPEERRGPLRRLLSGADRSRARRPPPGGGSPRARRRQRPVRRRCGSDPGSDHTSASHRLVPGSGRADQASRERLSRGQHRLRQRDGGHVRRPRP